MEITLEQLHRLEIAHLLLEHETDDPDPDIWRWSPLDIVDFDIMLKIAYEYFRITDSHSPGSISFAEAGSGIGTKLYRAAHEYGMTEFGWEVNPEYIEVANALKVHCEKRDLSDMENQPLWATYDVVYAARMFKDDLFQVRWEQQLQDAMRPGAVLIMSFCARKPYTWPCIFRRAYRGVWVKPNPDNDRIKDAVAAAIYEIAGSVAEVLAARG